MVKTVLNVKTDLDVKKAAQKTAGEIGIPLSMVVNAYLKDFVRTRSITLAAEPQYNPRVVKEILEASTDFKKGRNVSPVFENMEDAIAWLDGKAT
jgi:antitoxin component of RelBE/YafQ-DinJ toxin-antitoxin module